MKNLIYKELKLVIHPMLYLFACLGALLLIPAWPYSLAFIYMFFAVQSLFFIFIGNKEVEFSASLPLSKNYFVLSKFFSTSLLQLAQILVAIPFAVITSAINKNSNPLSMDANFTLFGIAFLGYSAFNVVFLPLFFKTGYKAGIPLLLGAAANIITVVLLEALIALIPLLKNNLDSISPATIGWQMIALFLGAGIYAASFVFSYKISCKNFEDVSL